MNTPRLAVAIAAFGLFFAAGCSKSASVDGARGDTLTLVKPAAVTLERGGMSKAAIKIQRKDLTGDVAIRFTHLPKGVDVVESDNRIVGDEGSYTLRAGDDADLVENHSAEVTATASTGGISVSQPILINVKSKN